MGNLVGTKRGAKITFADIQRFEKDTCFTAQEIIFLNHTYRQACDAEGCVDKEAFTQIFSNFNKSVKAVLFLDHIFRTWDVNQDGNLTFNEFIQALSVTSRGTAAQRAEYLFRLYDINGDEEITIDEFTSVLKLKVRKVELERMKEVFAAMDADGNGCLTKEEFVNACAKDKKLMTYLDIY